MSHHTARPSTAPAHGCVAPQSPAGQLHGEQLDGEQLDAGPRQPARRGVVFLGAAAALGVTGAAALAGCGSSSSGIANAGASGTAATGAGAALAKLASVPVGGAYAAKGPDGKAIVIAQPSAGKVVAYSAICTHQGCTVLVNGGQLDCPCHGSVFDALTGAVKKGPASSPLPSVAVTVSGTDVVAG